MPCLLRCGFRQIDFSAVFAELLRLLRHGRADFGRGHGFVLAAGDVADFLADFHRDEMLFLSDVAARVFLMVIQPHMSDYALLGGRSCNVSSTH